MKGTYFTEGALSFIYKKVKNDLAAESRPARYLNRVFASPAAKMRVQTTERGDRFAGPAVDLM
jgi:hypothetical protein